MTENKNTHGPGGLTSETSILLHTRQAMNVFDGRKETENKPAIYGVPRFSGSVNQIYKDAMADDPWADWWLVKIDDHIERAKMKLNEYQEEFRELYPNSPSININTAESTKPESRPLNFPTPSYAYRMGYLVVEYDQFCCEVLGMRHIGLLIRTKAERYLNLGGKALRAALQSGTGYRRQGVTRNDVLANNPKAQKATQLMGQIPDDILNMKRRSDFAPELRQYDKRESIEEASSNDGEANKKIKAVG
ncbi:MAG: TIGR03761 family integrating conjugative element protein [Gammaproteobacteria bacterium]|jgi:integrating conjugative element protein (TIGR03761 family)|nr:TIGR03761 family integrating conjugative element protein [Gammaproteobacteria bacterium]